MKIEKPKTINTKRNNSSGQMAIAIIVLAVGVIAGTLFIFSKIERPLSPLQKLFSGAKTINKNTQGQTQLIPVAPGSEQKSAEEILSEDKYYVVYQPQFDLYMLSIQEGPVDAVRAEAEQNILNRMGDKNTVCSLKWRVQVSKKIFGVAQTYDGLNICRK